MPCNTVKYQNMICCTLNVQCKKSKLLTDPLFVYTVNIKLVVVVVVVL